MIAATFRTSAADAILKAMADRDPQARRSGPGRFLQLDPLRALAAVALLAGLAALTYFVLLPGGSAGDAPPAAVLLDPGAGSPGVEPGVHPGDLARDFEASGLDDPRSRLSDLRGRPVVINFWATWCTSCLTEMPVLEQQRRAHQEEGLAIVAVNVGEGLGDAREFIEALDLFDFVIAMDPGLDIADAYGVRGLPHSVFIDANGVIEAEYQGQLDEETMSAYVLAAIEAAPPGEAPFRPRFVTTVPREHVLEVYPGDDGSVRFESRRFRCDDDYCGESLAEDVGRIEGVRTVEVDSDLPLPALTVAYDADALELEALVDAVATVVVEREDPLYTRELEVRYAD